MALSHAGQHAGMVVGFVAFQRNQGVGLSQVGGGLPPLLMGEVLRGLAQPGITLSWVGRQGAGASSNNRTKGMEQVGTWQCSGKRLGRQGCVPPARVPFNQRVRRAAMGVTAELKGRPLRGLGQGLPKCCPKCCSKSYSKLLKRAAQELLKATQELLKSYSRAAQSATRRPMMARPKAKAKASASSGMVAGAAAVRRTPARRPLFREGPHDMRRDHQSAMGQERVGRPGAGGAPCRGLWGLDHLAVKAPRPITYIK